MNKLYYFLAASAMLLGVSCSRQEIDTTESFDNNGCFMTFNAVIGDSDATRTAFISDDVSSSWPIYWTPGDAINIFYGGKSSARFETSDEFTTPGPRSEFIGYLQAATGTADGSGGNTTQNFWAVYPYDENNTCDGTSVTLSVPSEQLGVAGTFANNLNPTLALSPNLGLSFYNIGSWFIFTLTQENVVSATLKGANGETLVGKIKVSMDNDNRPRIDEIIEGKTLVTMTPEGGSFQTSQYYCMVILPGTFENGLILTLTKEDGAKAECTVKPKDGSPMVIKRSEWARKKNADSGLEWNHSINGHDYVDMGNGMLWATMNVGAQSITDYGSYFAWGETAPRSSTSTYTPDNFSEAFEIEYGLNASYHVLKAENDPATVNWKGSWRTPTDSEWKMLCDSDDYSWEWTQIEGVDGYLVTSNVEGSVGNNIFLPATGVYASNPSYLLSDNTHYWSSSHNLYHNSTIGTLNFTSSNYKVSINHPWFGQCIRPICNPFIPVQGIELDKTSLVMNKGEKIMLKIDVLPNNASYSSYKMVIDDTSIASITNFVTNEITANDYGTTLLTVTTGDGGYNATCEITVIDPTAVTGISLNRTALSLVKGSTETLIATILPSTSSGQSITWSSSNTSVVTVSTSGTVSGIKEGMATITAQCGDITSTCTIDVFEAVREDFNPNTYLIYKANNTKDTSGGNYYSQDSEFPGISGAIVELKFQLAGPSMITSGNMNHDYYDYMAINNTSFEWNDTYKDDGDWYDDTLEWRIPSATSLLWIKFDGVKHSMTINEIVSSCSRSTMSLPRLFATYDHESDEGIYEVVSGVPDGSKLYYAKAWNADGTLKAIGYATTAENPETGRTEYCWCTYSMESGKTEYTYAHDAVHQGGFEGYTYN